MLDQYVDTGKITFDVVNLTVEAENGTTLVDNVAFSLEESSLLAILGPSGSGKSSLVRALTGLTIPTSGDILYDGRSLYENFADLRDRIAYVSQQDSVHEHLTVEQALMYIAELRLPADIDPNEREQEVRSLIEELGLSGAANTRIDRISGGQRRRVTIASELLTRPSLLVLDEPTSGLDPGRERSVMQLLRSIADGGRTVIVVTHSIQELSLCDRVLFLAPGGEVAYFGPPDQVFEYFATDDYPGVFAQLDTPADRHQFGSQFAASPLYKEFVADPIRLRKRIGRAPHNRTQAGAVRGSPARQFGILVRRYLQLLSADRRSLLILLGQAPLLGLLILIVANANSLNPNLSLPRSGAVTVLLMIVISATLMGFLNAIREIVKERPIYLRERMVGLSIVAYVGSKFVVLAAIALLQVAILVPLALARQDGPNSSVVISPPGLEIFVAVSAAAIAAIGLALATSALVTRSDQAISLVSLLLVPQILLAGAIVPLEDSPVMRMISHAISAKWGFSAVASTVDLRTLNSFGTFTLPGMRFQLIQDTSWTPEVSYWVIDIAALGIIILVFLSLTIALMRRSDPAILQNAAHPGGILRDLNFIFHLRNIFRSCQGFAPKLLPGAFWAVINLLLRRFIL